LQGWLHRAFFRSAGEQGRAARGLDHAVGSGRLRPPWLRGAGERGARAQSWTLTQPPGLDFLLGHVLRGMRLAHVLIAAVIRCRQDIAESRRPGRSLADPARYVMLVTAPERRELAVLFLQFRHLLAHLGPRVGAFSGGRDLRPAAPHQGAPILPQAGPEEKEL